MEPHIQQHLSNITKLLDQFLQAECKIKNTQCLDKLLRYLEAKNTRDIYSTLIDLPVFTEWLMKTVPVWTLNKIQPCREISYFTLKFASLVTRNEMRFCNLNNNNFFTKLVRILKARDRDAPISIKLVYIQLLSSFLEHQSGIEWMVASNLWEDILELAVNSRNIFVLKESRIFMARILEKVINYDVEFCCGVTKKILLPLTEYNYKVITTLGVETKEFAVENLKPTLNLIEDIVKHFFLNEFKEGQDLKVMKLFVCNNLKEHISNTRLISEDHACLRFSFSKIIITVKFLNLCLKRANFDENIVNFMRDLHFAFEELMLNHNIDNIIEFCSLVHLYSHFLHKKIPDRENPIEAMADKLVFVQSLPVGAVHFRFSKFRKCDVEDTFRENFIDEVVTHIFDQDIFRKIYHFRDYLIDLPINVETAKKAQISIANSIKYYTRKRALIEFNLLAAQFNSVVSSLRNNICSLEEVLRHSTFLSLHLNLLANFIEGFDISWKDCALTIDMMDEVFDFMKMLKGPSNVMVNALKLYNVSLKHELAPNMILLTDRVRHSSIYMIAEYFHTMLSIVDVTADVKNMMVEIVRNIAIFSKNKFPSLQKVLMDSDLPGLVVKMATADGESFVRATAIKCLQEMIQVEEIWNNSLKSQDLAGKMRHILVNETEGIVRVEAATFMCISYENNQFPEETLDKIYETMIHSSTSDLHWEVKVRALNFWDKVINNHLQHQGMIDGSFPNVTFSKEHRKIVTLTDAEIKKRLTKVLGQLSGIGCLGVLISAIRDDCDMEVSKTAVKITQKLLELLKKYNINADSSLPVSPQSTDNGMSSSASISSGVSADDFINSPLTPVNSDLNEEVINQIVNSRDSTLLQNVYAQSDYGSVINYDMQVRKIVSPNEFLLFTQQDLNVIINEKKNWLNGIEDLGSLLDDMLKSYDDDDVNSMDCY